MGLLQYSWSFNLIHSFIGHLSYLSSGVNTLPIAVELFSRYTSQICTAHNTIRHVNFAALWQVFHMCYHIQTFSF